MSRGPHAWTSAHPRTSTRGTSLPARDLRPPGVRPEGSRDDHASATQGTGWARRAPRTLREEIEVPMRALGTCSDASARTSAEVARSQREARGARGDGGGRRGADAGCRGASGARRGVQLCRRDAHGRCGGAHLGHRAAVVKCGGAGARPREAVACRDEGRASRRRPREREGRDRALGREGAARCSGACELPDVPVRQYRDKPASRRDDDVLHLDRRGPRR
jgi:hypothetical protein